jgi:glucose-6-phosphate isomerase
MSSVPSFGPDRLMVADLGVTIDFSALPVPADLAAGLDLAGALARMAELEAGAMANPDEQRRVGHYWLRAPELAPDPAVRTTIEQTRERIEAFAARVHDGSIGPLPGRRFDHLLLLGIGGSALGPQLAADALGGPGDPLTIDFLDNTDPEGFARAFARIGPGLARTLAVVVSKSGGTAETRNGLEELRARLLAHGLDPARHLVAVTGAGSALDTRARSEGWLEVFPMWDWVGGRTSETSAVGLLPMSLLDHDVASFLSGARAMDEATRVADAERNPALRLALAWYAATGGAGRRDMVVLPYRDRLVLLSRYLQQLVMESLGKELDLEGRTVHQGIAVYGNKGSTDQHAFVQQLRDGLDNFFVTFIVALDDHDPRPLAVEPGTTSGDYLLGFFLGTRRALVEKGRLVLTIPVPAVDAGSLGALIALYERTVGFYAALVGINAYHQPGVEAGKKAAGQVLALQRALVAAIAADPQALLSAREWAERAGLPAFADEAGWVLAHLAANRRGVEWDGERYRRGR